MFFLQNASSALRTWTEKKSTTENKSAIKEWLTWRVAESCRKKAQKLLGELLRLEDCHGKPLADLLLPQLNQACLSLNLHHASLLLSHLLLQSKCLLKLKLSLKGERRQKLKKKKKEGQRKLPRLMKLLSLVLELFLCAAWNLQTRTYLRFLPGEFQGSSRPNAYWPRFLEFANGKTLHQRSLLHNNSTVGLSHTLRLLAARHRRLCFLESSKLRKKGKAIISSEFAGHACWGFV